MAMSDAITARAGNDGALLCEFDGRVLELWNGPSERYLAEELVLQKRKDKDGGAEVFIVPDGNGPRFDLWFGPDELANMEKLLAALTKAGMKTGG
jgi:hypothetical protein